MTTAREQNLNGLRKFSRESQLCSLFINWNHRRRPKEGYLTFTGGRLGGREKAKQGHLWDGEKVKRTDSSLMQVGAGPLAAHITARTGGTQGTRNNGGALRAPVCCGGCAPRALEKGLTGIPRVCHLSCKKTTHRLT